MARIDTIRWLFNDYEDNQIIVPMWSEYSFHINESSLRNVVQAEQKLRIVLAGGTIDTQAWRDLRSVYGLATEHNTISTLGNDFITFCNTATSDFAKEFWLYRQLYHSQIDSLRNQQIRRINNIYRLLYSVPNSLFNVILNGSNTSDRILSFAEHLISFPLALEKFFELPWNDLVELVTFNDNQFRATEANFLPTEVNLKKLMVRINTYNRTHYRRRISIISAMLIPIMDRIILNGSSPFRVYAPFVRFFSRPQIEGFLTDLNYQVHTY